MNTFIVKVICYFSASAMFIVSALEFFLVFVDIDHTWSQRLFSFIMYFTLGLLSTVFFSAEMVDNV